MKLKHRKATIDDAGRLFALRRKSIVELAPRGMSVAQAEVWAANLTIEQDGAADSGSGSVDRRD